MPEGDTVHRAARLLNAAIAGSVLTKSDIRLPRFATVNLAGQTVLEVLARGKHLLIRTDGGLTLHSHLGMEGKWTITRIHDGLPGPAHEIRVILETSHRRVAGLRLRIFEVIQTHEEHVLLEKLGPDVLGIDWSLEEATRRMEARPDETISAALLDQSIVAGFGNIYRNEICFLRGYDPWRLVRDCDARATLRLGKKIIEANREHARHVTTGDARARRSWHVYGRRGQPCLRCGTRILKRDNPDERVTYWCPSCQSSP